MAGAVQRRKAVGECSAGRFRPFGRCSDPLDGRRGGMRGRAFRRTGRTSRNMARATGRRSRQAGSGGGILSGRHPHPISPEWWLRATTGSKKRGPRHAALSPECWHPALSQAARIVAGVPGPSRRALLGRARPGRVADPQGRGRAGRGTARGGAARIPRGAGQRGGRAARAARPHPPIGRQMGRGLCAGGRPGPGGHRQH